MKSSDLRIKLFAKAALLSLVISGLVGGIWSALIVANLSTTPAIPWAVPAMAAVLWLGWHYLGGAGWPQRTWAVRRRYLRANPVSRQAFVWALLAGVLSIVALTGYWILAFDLVKMPGNAVTPLANPTLAQYSPVVVALAIAMGSLVSPLSEQAGFRGYALVILERAFPRSAAIVISSLLFITPHFPVADLWLPKLLVYFLAGVTFALIADRTNSILASIPVDLLGDATFFMLVWPFDAGRQVIWETAPDVWFWLHVTQPLVFTALTYATFRRLAIVAARPNRPSP